MDSTVPIAGNWNVLVYYGVGGIGKTTLSERLEKWCRGELPPTDAWGPAPRTGLSGTCRIDLHRERGHMDLLSGLIAIRRAFGGVKPKWPAFDVAFATYWSSVYPNEPLPTGDGKDTVLSDGVRDSLAETLSDLGIPGAGITTRAVRKVVNEIRDGMRRRALFARYPGFAELLQQCADLPTADNPHLELLGDIAGLLDVDLTFWDGPHAPQIVVFIDTFERLEADPRRVDEAALNELVWRLPNVLFVITGRNYLDWHDEGRQELFIAGPLAWPGLVLENRIEPRQHRVGDLSAEDTAKVIDRGRQLYEVEVADDVAHQLATASGGLPQYLDLALELARNRKAVGGPPISVADVAVSTRALVLRVLEDVPPLEQRVIRAASLFPYFNRSIVAAAAGVEEYGVVDRALARSMIDQRGSTCYPYSMHDTIREAVRNSDHTVPNGWSAEDWKAAGERGLEALRGEVAAYSRATDIEGSLEALTLAIGLVSDQPLEVSGTEGVNYVDWLSRAIVFGPGIAVLARGLPVAPKTARGREISDFVNGNRAELPLETRVRLLDRVFRSGSSLMRPAGRHLGYELRDAGYWDEAIAVFAELVERFPSAVHKYQHAFTHATARRFDQALALGTGLPEFNKARLAMTVGYRHGRVVDYLGSEQRYAESLRAKERHREALAAEAIVIRLRALVEGAVDTSVLNDLRERALAANHSVALRGELLGRAYSNPAAITDDEMVWMERTDRIRNGGEPGYRTATMRLALALWRDDLAGLEAVAALARARRRPRSSLWIPVECVLDSYGFHVEAQPARWLEPYEVVRDRWRTIYDDWLSRVRAS